MFKPLGASTTEVAVVAQLDQGDARMPAIALILYEYVVPGLREELLKAVESAAGVAMVAQPAALHAPVTR
jgi:hypothetical protein